jgi:hypothetical protein
MLGFLGWLLVQWVTYSGGAESLACIFGTAAAGAAAAVAPFARRRRARPAADRARLQREDSVARVSRYSGDGYAK